MKPKLKTYLAHLDNKCGLGENRYVLIDAKSLVSATELVMRLYPIKNSGCKIPAFGSIVEVDKTWAI